jgi:hypothetical protein
VRRPLDVNPIVNKYKYLELEEAKKNKKRNAIQVKKAFREDMET